VRTEPAPARPTAAPARQSSLRDRNLALVLEAVATASEPLSRADLAETTGLTRATVSTLVDVLIEGRFISELEPRRTRTAGRPATDLVLSGDGLVGIGLEANVDYLAASVVDLAGCVHRHTVVHADQRGREPEAVLRELARLVGQIIDACDREGLRAVGVTLAVPGLVDGDAGLVRTAPNLGWTDVDAAAVLGSAPQLAGLPLHVDNEANLGALAELDRGGGDGGPSFLYISGEIGVGAGIVIDGSLFRGARGWSGEIGHVAVHSDTSVASCRCGAVGCLETVAGQDALLAAAGVESVDALIQAATASRRDALRALAAAGRALGVAAAGALNMLDVVDVVLGGIYPPLIAWLRSDIERELGARVLSARWAPPRLRAGSVGAEAAVLGAAHSVVRSALATPAAYL
jgi:predicted NBD/HSP70 family sugar kinase